MSLESIFAFATVSFAIAVSPGASWAYVITMTIHGQRRGGFCAILGNAIGIFLHAIVAFLGLALLVQLVPQFSVILKWLGAFYLFYIGIKNIRNSNQLQFGKKENNYVSIVWDGVMMNLLNPKVSILMLTLLPQFTNIEKNKWHILWLGMLHICIASCVLSTVVLFVEKLLEENTDYSTFSKISGIVLCLFGLHLAIF